MMRAIVIVPLLVGMAGCGAPPDEQSQAQEDTSVGVNVAASTQPGIGPLRVSPDYYKCADEHGFCATAFSYVAFGARGKYLFRSAVLGLTCDVNTFGGDPIEGVEKACYLANIEYVAPENAPFSWPGAPREFVYGSNGRFHYADLSGPIHCDNDTFGDPNEGVPKECFLSLPGYNVDVAELGTMTGLNDTPIAYGANGKFVFKFASGSHPCTNEAFGRDPAKGVPKRCYRMPVVKLANDGQTGISDGQYTLYLSGLNGNYVIGAFSGSFTCNRETFGGQDPDIDRVEACYRFVP